MVSGLNLLSVAGMIAVGAIAVLLWRGRARVEYFLFGAVFRAAAIAIKVAMDLTVTLPFQELLPHTTGGVLALSVALKSILDGSLPLFAYAMPARTFAFYVTVEAYVAALGFLSICGLHYLKRRYDQRAHQA